MNKVALYVFIFVLISVAVYFGVAAVLIISATPEKRPPNQGGLAFKELFVDYARIPHLRTFTARDGELLSYRYYPSQSDTGAHSVTRRMLAQPVFSDLGRVH